VIVPRPSRSGSPGRPVSATVWWSSTTSAGPLAGGLVLLAVAVLTGLGAQTSGASPGWADPLNTALVTVLFIAPVVGG